MREFILGTDWWTDCDDAAALRIIARAFKRGEINIACIGINACMQYSAASLISFLHSEGVNGLKAGIDRDATDFGGSPPYQKRLALMMDKPVTNDDIPDAVQLYIETLKRSEGGLEIIEIGYPQVLARALKAEPELFRQKVKHVWMMAGKWDDNPGRENNFARNKRASEAAAYFCAACPVPVTFLGWEVSHDINAGSQLKDGDVLKSIFADHGSFNGRSAWDPMLVELALSGSAEKCGYETVRGKASVDPLTGSNYFTVDESGPHCFVKKALPDEIYKNRIDALIASE